MPTETHRLEPILMEVVRNTYESKLAFHDPEITTYVTRLLCEFSEPDRLFRLRDEQGRPIKDVHAMVQASDPVFGTAASFDAERAARKYIGDYALFATGMCHEILRSDEGTAEAGLTLDELIAIGRESYHIVSQFNLCEYEGEAALFARLADRFDRCVLGLALVREEMGERLKLKTICN
ncbi:MAG TPA: hypothetical protein VK716_18340 [Terracidiphilus sp.]|jgi:hypothetical protein|nr:hypothetical protein [Terracidiphilus sp.]